MGVEDVLDVDHPDHFIQAVAGHRQAAVPGLGEGGESSSMLIVCGTDDDLAARDRDLARGAVAEVKQVAQHLPLERGEVAALGRRGVGLVDRFLDLVAQRGVVILAENQRAHPAPQPRSAFLRVVVASRHQSRSP